MRIVLLLFLQLIIFIVFAQSEFSSKAKWDTLQILALLVKSNITQ